MFSDNSIQKNVEAQNFKFPVDAQLLYLFHSCQEQSFPLFVHSVEIVNFQTHEQHIILVFSVLLGFSPFKK